MKSPTAPVEMLRRFIDQVDDLRARRVIQNKDLRSAMTIKGSTNEGVQFEHHEPDEEDLRSYLLDFRKFMSADEPVFLNRIFNIAYRHVTDKEIVDNLKAVRERWKQELRQGGMEFIVNDETLMPETVMDLWINGSYFHDDEEKARRLEQLASVPMSRWLFINGVVGATNVIFYVDHLIGIALRDSLVSDTPVR